MVPAAAVDDLLVTLAPLLQANDTILDGGNSYCHDDLRRAAELAALCINHVDVGTSGGVAGLNRGYCLMIRGKSEVVQHLAPLFTTLAPRVGTAVATPGRRVYRSADQGWLHCELHGAGHFVKMVHNGIEYGVMAAYAEGLNILRHANVGKQERDVDAETTPLRQPELPILDGPARDCRSLASRQRYRFVAARPDGHGTGRRPHARWLRRPYICWR